LEGAVQAVVSDIAGRVVACPYVVSESALEFDVGQLLPGLYYVTLQIGQRNQVVYKFVKA